MNTSFDWRMRGGSLRKIDLGRASEWIAQREEEIVLEDPPKKTQKDNP